MRKKFILLFVCMQILCIASVFSQVTSTWDGSSIERDWYLDYPDETEYTITSAAELAGLADLVKNYGVTFEGKTINIGDDPSNPITIDLDNYSWTPIGYYTSSSSIQPFAGNVNGNNCIVKNFKTTGSYRGLFGYVKSQSADHGITISNINVESNVAGTQYVGGICGYVSGYNSSTPNVTIVNCTYNGNLTATPTSTLTTQESYAGGIAGYAAYTVINNCATAGSVKGCNYVAGIAGDLYGKSSNSKANNCVNAALVEGNKFVGGIVGYLYKADVNYSMNGGNVYGKTQFSGGIIGAYSSSGTLTQCLSSGTVEFGGAISGSNLSTATYCYYDKQRVGSAMTGRYGTADASGKYIGKTATELIAGTDLPGWTAAKWSYEAGRYPIPSALATATAQSIARLAAAPIFTDAADASQYYNTVSGNFELCDYASWSPSNAFISVSSTTATVDGTGTARLTATVDGRTKVVDVTNVSSDFHITNLADLEEFRDAINRTDNYKGYVSHTGFAGCEFILDANINMSSIENWEPIGTYDRPMCATFNGNNKKITSLNVESSTPYSGLFGCVSASIKDLSVKGNVTGTTYVGGICGYVKSSITSTWTCIKNCHFNGEISTTSTGSTNVYVGGICGYVNCARVEECSVNGSIQLPITVNYVGGIVGYMYGGSSTSALAHVKNCINLADVRANSSVGGIVGYIYRYTDVENNLNEGHVESSSPNVGGIVGYCNNKGQTRILKNVNAGTVILGGSSIVGKLVAGTSSIPEVTVSNNYYDKQCSILGGKQGEDVDEEAEGKTTSELSALAIDGFTTSDTDLYPIPAGFLANASFDGKDNLINVAKASVIFGGTYVINVDTDDPGYVSANLRFTVKRPGSVQWIVEGDTDGIIDRDEITSMANLTGVYGAVDVQAYKGNYSKNVYVKATGGSSVLKIESYEDLKDFRDAVNAGADGGYKGQANINGFSGIQFKVTAPINMADEEPWMPIGISSDYPFRGNFDGGNYPITNITVSKSSNYAGLFGYVVAQNNAVTIKNINLSGSITNTKSYTAGIVGYANGVSTTVSFTLQNCHFNGTISSGSYAGGICGYLGKYSSIKDCTAAGAKLYSTSTKVGGICAHSVGYSASVRNEVSGCACIFNEISGKASTNEVGGIVGYAKNTDVAYCINAALIEVANTAVGGVAGKLDAAANLTECLNFITVKGIGKIYGTLSDGTVTACYYDKQHCVSGTDNGEGKTTSQMKSLSLTAEKWNTEDVNMYPIPINISSHSAAIVAATPVTFAGSEDNQTVESSFTVYTPTGLVWTSDDDAAITIEDDDVNVTVNYAFSRIYLTATIGVYSKKVLLRNSNFVDEIPISTFAELKAFREAVNDGNDGSYTYTPAIPPDASPVTVYNVDGFSGVTFKLTADIQLDATNWTAIGSAATNTFNGIFDGDGHAITKLRTSTSGHGLFGYIVGATIRNLTVTTYSATYKVAGSSEVGGIVGKATRSTIENCKFNGYVNATGVNAGGIVGYAISSNIANCVTAGVISSSSNRVGGICGYVDASADATVIENCVSSMDISGVTSVGGIAGNITSTTVQNCLFAGNVSGTTQNVGGIVGYIANGLSPITNNLNAGTAYNGGAIIGYMHPDNETNSNVNVNYYDNQHNDLEHGIAVLGEDGPTSEVGTAGSLTSNLIGDRTPDIFATGWTESAGMYPAPEGMTGAAVDVAVVPVILNSSEKYNSVKIGFTFGSADATGNEWSVVNSDGAYVTRNDDETSATVNDIHSSATLTATYTDAAGISWKRNVRVFNPDPSEPLIIENYDRFIEFRDAVNAGSTGAYKGVPNVNGFAGKSFKFADDLSTIDISGAWTPIGKSADYAFKGTFIGNGKTVTGLNVDAPTASYKGLFGYVVGGSISDLNVEGNVSGKSYVGGICGYIKGASSANYSSITNCTFNGSVNATATYAGGIVGYNYTYSVVKECMVAGSVTAASTYAGGISGCSYGTSSALDTISSCANAAKVAGTQYVGGIVGKNYYTRTEYCNNGGNVVGMDYMSGGITGNNASSSHVAYCLNTGLVNRSISEPSDDYGGAIIGYNQSATYTLYNYYDKLRTSVKGISSASAGSSDVAGKAEGLSTTELTGSTPSGLDPSIWRPAYWTFVDNYYPIPTVLGENDFTLATSTPIFIVPPVKWDAVITGCNITLGGNLSITRWESSDGRYINVDDPENVTIEQWNDNNAALLTATVNEKVSKVFQYIDYGDVKDLFIVTLEDLKDFRDAVNDAANGSYKGILNSNSHYSGYRIWFEPEGGSLDISSETNWEPIGKDLTNCFAGEFSGESNTMAGLTVTSSQPYAGLFGYVKTGSISDLNLENVTISNSASYTGAICGYIVGSSASESVISNCSVAGGTIKATVTDSYLGGIVGAMGNYTYISDCSNAADLTGRRYIGGICGYHVPSADRSNVEIITSCYNSGNINEGASVASYYYVGGIVGDMQSSGNVVACENTGNVTSGHGVGGIAGYFYGSNEYGRAGAISDCVNSGVITSTNTTKANAGGIVGLMGAKAKVERAINIGAVSGKKTNVGGIVGNSAATNFLHTNTISMSINGGKVSCADGNVGGICGIDTLTTITYNNNGGIVEGNNEATAGGIAGYNAANSELNYNLSTGTVLPSAVTNGLCGTNNGTVTDKNFYDRQRTLGDVDDESGKLTQNITGALMGSDFTEDWADYFDFGAGRYPIPNAVDNSRSEAILAATPIYIDNATPEVYDSVTIAFSLGSADDWEATWDSELTEDLDVVTIGGTTATVERKCEDIPVTLTATMDEFTKEYLLIVAKKMPEILASVDDGTYVWYGREAEWNTNTNWRTYNESETSFETPAEAPSTTSNVYIADIECMEKPEVNSNITLNKLDIEPNIGIVVSAGSLLTISNGAVIDGEAVIEGGIKGDVTFTANAPSPETSTGYIEGTITRVGSGDFKFLTGNADGMRAAFKMTPAGGEEATVTVRYDTTCYTASYPDWWSHGGNMGGGLNHVSDREYWLVNSNKNLEDVTLFWADGDHGIEDEEVESLAENMKVAYYNNASRTWVNAGGSVMDGADASHGYVTAIDVIPFGGSRDGGTYITAGSTKGANPGLVLPIELVSFTATCDGNVVDVEWTTASERNNDYFILEKSYDAVNFAEIARISGAGNSIEEQNYSYVDHENYGGEMYYRLVQVDYDGTRNVSEKIFAKCTDHELEPSVAIFPNPFRSELKLSLANFGNKPATVEVFDIMGTLVRTFDIDATGNDYEAVLNLDDLSAATYTLRVSTANFVINKRIVKQ